MEKNVYGSTSGGIALLTGTNYDKFVAENSRLLFSEGVKKEGTELGRAEDDEEAQELLFIGRIPRWRLLVHNGRPE